jgi:LmbE family N-acetylglucosaminyl deacetylase
MKRSSKHHSRLCHLSCAHHAGAASGYESNPEDRVSTIVPAPALNQDTPPHGRPGVGGPTSWPHDERQARAQHEDAPPEGSAGELSGYGFYRLRSAHYDEIYFSPHMDDAVYSCGGQILLQRAEHKRVLIITVFGTGESDGDEHAGDLFRDTAQRKREELAAMEKLDADFLFLNLPDALHRRHSPGEFMRMCLPFLPLISEDVSELLVTSVEALVRRLLLPNGQLYFPLGVGSHPDHRLVFDVGRHLNATGKYRVSFYEDVAYVHVRGMREDRLRCLGYEVRLPFFAFVLGVHRFIFRRAPKWQGILWWPGLFTFLLVRWLIQRTTGLADRRPEERDPRVEERDITSAVEKKVEAMRAYATQTEYFFSTGEAMFQDLVRSEERFVERYWSFPSTSNERLLGDEHARVRAELRKVESLLRELQTGEAVALQGVAARERTTAAKAKRLGFSFKRARSR